VSGWVVLVAAGCVVVAGPDWAVLLALADWLVESGAGW
jgi:hypothetical protein